jgi:hypothetical protein
MKYSLRSLMIVVAVAPPLLAGMYRLLTDYLLLLVIGSCFVFTWRAGFWLFAKIICRFPKG